MNLECTCRALSSDVVSARAIAEKARRQRTTDIERRMAKSSLHENGPEEKESMPNVDNGTTGGEDGKTGIKGKEKATQNTAKDQAKEKTKSTKKKSARSNRSSKRVLSKRITSGKNAERSAKRKSAEYCLVSAVFSCTSQHPVYSECLKKESQASDNLAASADSMSPAKNVGGASNMTFLGPDDSSSLVGDLDSSLKAFVLRWSEKNSGPNDILVRFLLHVSWYIDDVFSSEAGAGDVVALSSCVLECKLLGTGVWIFLLSVEWNIFALTHLNSTI